MKLTKVVFLCVALLGGMTMNAAPAGEKPSQTRSQAKEVVSFHVSMDCKNCEAKITEKLRFEKGVQDLMVNLAQKRVTITFRNDKTSAEKLAGVIRSLGYEVTPWTQSKAAGSAKQ